jgi:cell division protein FtsQ
MRKNWLLNIQLITIFGLVIFLYSFTSKRNEQRKISKPQIEFLNAESPFVTHEMVNNLLIEKFGGASTIKKENLDLKSIEQTLNKHSLIDDSEVYVSVDGRLKTIVKQKSPIARVFNNNASFYIDYEGGKMPLSKNFSARVPLVYGKINTAKDKDFVSLLQMIHNDDFLKKNIIGMQVLEDGSVVMKNRNYSYDIVFGRTIHMERKFNNYKAFFQKAVQDTLIDSYKSVNLKFTKQVVCTKE